jgi:glycosyltransferase involved in cell wall biosynthesis
MPSQQAPRVAVIVPAYNEAANLPRVIEELRQCCPTWDVLVVDDGSTDNSGAVAAGCGARVLRLPFNLGIGGAVQAGLIYAARHAYDACVQVDGDAQHEGPETVKLVRTLLESGVDVVVGSRFLGEGGFRSTASRRLGISVLRGTIRLLTGQTVSDPTSGHRAFGRNAIALLARNYPQDYPEPEAIYLLLRSGLRALEIPVRMRARQSGRSSIGVVDSLLYMVKVLLSILVQATKRPLPVEESPS